MRVAQDSDVAGFHFLVWMLLMPAGVCMEGVGVGVGGEEREEAAKRGCFSGMKSLDDRWGKKGEGGLLLSANKYLRD